MLFEKNRFIGVFVYSILAFSCIVQITRELGFHNFSYIGSHHGLLIFSLGSLLDYFSSTLGHFHEAKNNKKS
jgi:hypothetical protein